MHLYDERLSLALNPIPPPLHPLAFYHRIRHHIQTPPTSKALTAQQPASLETCETVEQIFDSMFSVLSCPSFADLCLPLLSFFASTILPAACLIMMLRCGTLTYSRSVCCMNVCHCLKLRSPYLWIPSQALSLTLRCSREPRFLQHVVNVHTFTQIPTLFRESLGP